MTADAPLDTTLLAFSLEIRVKRFVFVGQYGAIINPLNLRNQIMGALIMGMAARCLKRCAST